MPKLKPYHKRNLIWLFLILLFSFSLYLLSFSWDFSGNKKIVFGVTFSDKYAKELTLDWQKTYLAILDELKVTDIRLVAYWDDIQIHLSEYDYSNLDWQVNEAKERNVNIMLAVGRRAPRWPECHDPSWLSGLDQVTVQQKQLEFVKRTIERYKDVPQIKYWQIENEPLFGWFGECPKPDLRFFAGEVAMARSLDSRPIVITDSGELNHWQGAAGLADILGTTLYRVVWNPYIGFWEYFFVPPAGYYAKASLTRFFHPSLQKVIITELQMEPWTFNKSMVQLTIDEQRQSFDLARFKDNIRYVKAAGYEQSYLWGVEYWYWLKQLGYPELWQEAQKLWP